MAYQYQVIWKSVTLKSPKYPQDSDMEQIRMVTTDDIQYDDFVVKIKDGENQITIPYQRLIEIIRIWID